MFVDHRDNASISFVGRLSSIEKAKNQQIYIVKSL
jgi:hypothetical protein